MGKREHCRPDRNPLGFRLLEIKLTEPVISQKKSVLQAGFGRCDLTPNKPCFLVGYPHVERTSTGQHDPLLASVLVLEQGGTHQAYISIDWLFVTAEWTRECRAAIEDATGIQSSAILIGATHTHSGPHIAEVLAWRDDPVVPPVDGSYLAASIPQVKDAVVAAVAALQPMKAAWLQANVEGIVGGNRIDADGSEDPEAGLLVLRASDTNEISAILSVYGMHPTVLHEDSTLFSGDFIHYTRQSLERAFPRAGVVYLNGVCGNQSPRRVVRGQTFAEADRIGTALGARLASEILNQKNLHYATSLPLAVGNRRIKIEGKHFPSVEAAVANLVAAREHYQRLRAKNVDRVQIRTAECAVFGAEEVHTLAHAEASGDAENLRKRYSEAEIQVLKIGDCAIAAWPGEFFVEYGLELKSQAPLPVFPVTLANGDLQGYVVTPEAEMANGYEAQMSLFPASLGKQFVSTTLEMLQEMAPTMQT